MISFKTYAEAPYLAKSADEIGYALCPGFLLTNPNDINNWPRLRQEFAAYQVVIVDDNQQQPIGVINTVPLNWQASLEYLPEEGWDWALANAELGGNWHCILFIAIIPAYRGQQLAEKAVQIAKQLGQTYGHQGTIVPVRPTRKKCFPTMSMAAYLEKHHEDGRVYDPWLRLHLKLGAKIIKICHRAMTITLSLEEWFKYGAVPHKDDPQELIVPDGLVPVRIISGKNIGIYEEPNVWLVHNYY